MSPIWKDVLFVARLARLKPQGSHLQFMLRMGSVDALSEDVWSDVMIRSTESNKDYHSQDESLKMMDDTWCMKQKGW